MLPTEENQNSKTCEHCHEPLTEKEIAFCEELAAKYEYETIHYEHSACLDEAEKEEVRNGVQISQAVFDKLNAARLLCVGNPNFTPQANQHEALAALPLFLIDQTLEQKFMSLIKMETVAAAMSAALAPQRRQLEDLFKEQDKQKLEQRRKALVAERDSAKLSGLPADRELNAVLYPHTKQKIAKKQLTLEEKSIQGLMKQAMLTREEAEAIVHERAKKRGVN